MYNMLKILNHELYTPATIISGYLALLQDDPDFPPEWLESIRIAYKAARQFNHHIRNATFLIDPNQITEGREVINLTDEARDVVARAIYYLEEGKQIEFARVGDTYIYANKTAARRVIDNLLHNAIKFLGDGKRVLISIYYQSDNVVVEVQDEGIGIPQNEFRRIFQPLTQVDMSDTRPYGGAGLGLAVVKAVMEAYGGRVAVTSELGAGSTFWLFFPAAKNNG